VRSIPHLGTAADASWAHLLARIRASTNPDALQALAEVARAFPPRISDDETTSLWSHARQLIRSTADVSRLPDIASAITALPGRPNATISNEIWEDLTARLEAAADRGDLAGLVAAAASLVHAPIVPPGDIRRRERQARDAIRIWLAIDVYADRDDVTKAFAAAHTGQPIGDFAHDMLELLKYPTISQRVSDALVALLRDEAKRQGAAFEGDLGAALEWAARNRYPIDRSSRPRHPCSTDTISIGMCGPFVQKTRVALIPFLGEAQ
jgi:hypothetical protein